jgi:hypothetical protein
MKTVEEYLSNERMSAAVNELQTAISSVFPEAQFELYAFDDPEGLYIRTTVDIDDTDQVIDTIIDRLVTFQFEDLLPIHVIPVRTPERQAALREKQNAERIRRSV